jgi:alanine racemase
MRRDMDPAAQPLLTIDLDALAANHAVLVRQAAGAEVAPVVKADGYGLGVAPVSRRLWAEGARSFFVARLSEGETLRAALGPDRPATIYVLDGFTPGAGPQLAEADLQPVLNSLEQIAEATAFGRAHGALDAILHVDTGLNRLGLRVEEAVTLAADPGKIAGVRLQMVMSHLACGPEPEHPLNPLQLERFGRVATAFPGVRRSLANSAGVFLGADYHFELVRPGISLYGGGPFERSDRRIKAVARLEALVVQVRDVPAGESVGYGALYVADQPRRIAIASVGHADGVLRALQARGRVWLDGAPRPLLGQVSMDVIAIDVTGAEVKPGDMAEILGPNALVDDQAAAAGTISYELLVRISARARRVYIGEVD